MPALPRRLPAALALLLGLLLAGLAATAPAQARTVWLCKPGQSPDPCRGDLTTTVTAPNGATRVQAGRNATAPRIDCFYVYPTVSGQPTLNATLAIDPEEVAIAHQQAARFSQRCRVFAPVYPQLTLQGISPSTTAAQAAAGARRAYAGVLAAWKDYLRHDNHGRGVVLIGHSQGAGMLEALVGREIDPFPGRRRRLVSAILLGGNVVVPRGRDVGGTFRHVPACRSDRQLGCVVAYSTFDATPPPNARFGRGAGAFAQVFGARKATGRVLCTNPAALGGGSAPLATLLRTEPFPGALGLGLSILYAGAVPTAPTPWLVPQDRYTARCSTAGGASVLRIAPVGASRVLTPSPDATWGLHLADVNIALGDLTRLVGTESAAYGARG